MTDNKKIVFFDFDGVIADSFDIAFGINRTVDSSIVTKKDFQQLFNGNINDWAKNTSYSKEEIDRIDVEFWKRYIPETKKVKIFSGIEDVIMELSQKYPLLIISSNQTDHIQDFLERNNLISCFNEIVGNGQVCLNKTERMKTSFKKHEVESKDCLFITDTLGDIKEADKVGMQSIAVSWGYQEKEDLIKGNPFGIANSPKEILNIVSTYFND